MIDTLAKLRHAVLLPRSWTASAALLLLLGLAPLQVAPASAAEFSSAQKTELGGIIKDYLIKNPEVLRDALAELDKRQKAEEVAARQKVVSDQAGKLFSSNYQVVVGNPKGNVTLVEFFDYNCGYCKKALDDLSKLMKADPNLRVVLKDFPVLGPGSVEAAQVAGAVRAQFKGDKFFEFHQKLLQARGQVGKAQAMAVAKELGADMDRLAKDMDSADVRTGIEEVMQVADQLNLTGTPSFVIGQDVVVGAVGYDEMKSKVDMVRKCGKVVC